MENKIILFDESRGKMLEGMNELSRAVTSTLGPKGRNVIMYLDHHRMGTSRDGVTVAEFIRFSDPLKDVGARFAQEAANQTLLSAGDGTSTSVLMTYILCGMGAEFLQNKNFLMRDYNEGMLAAVKNVVNELVQVEAEQINGNFDLIEDVATISANNDRDLGRLIRKGMEVVGMNGMVQTEDSGTNVSSMEIVDGMEIQNGFYDYAYVNIPKRATCELGGKNKPVEVIIIDEDLTSTKQVVPILKYVASTKAHAVIVANEIIGEADAMIKVNASKANLNLCVVRAPGAGDRRRAYSRDLAVFTNALVIGQDTGTEVENFEPEWAGACKKFVADVKNARFIEGAGAKEDVDELISSIEAEMKTTHDEFAITKHKQRIQRLRGKAAVLKVGAQTGQELGQLKGRVDDAIKATQSSIEEGIVPGGGTAYLRIHQRLDRKGPGDYYGKNDAWNAGFAAVVKALMAPVRKIIENAGENHEDVVNVLLSPKGKNKGYNAVSGKIEDMKKAGVINAAKVERVALENAVSAATAMLSTECVIYPETTTQEKTEDERTQK